MKPSPQFAAIVSAALLSLISAGCSHTAPRGSTAASAPALEDGGQAHIRGVSDPNAPFTLIDRQRSTARPVSVGSDGAVPLCGVSALQVYEAAASVTGDFRVVRLALKNRSEAACRIGGSPAINLQDDSGRTIASIAVSQTGETSLRGTVAATASASGPVEVILQPSGEASFEIGWSSGEGCPLVSRFTVSMPHTASASSEASPAFAGSFIVNHALNVCNGEVRVSSLTTGGSV